MHSTAMTSRQRRRAFSLLELVLVLAVIAIALAAVAPTLRGWHRGSHLRDAGDQFLTLTRLARTRAVANAQVHRLSIDAAAGRCFVAVQDGQQWAKVDTGMDGWFDIPEGVTIKMTDTQGASRDYIEFFPTGRTQATRVHLSMDDGQLDITCDTPTEGFRLVQPGETR